MDNVEIEIANYLNKIGEGEISEESSRRVQAMYKIISELESIGDSGVSIAKILQRKISHNASFDHYMLENIDTMMSLLEDSIDEMIKNLELGYTKITNINEAEEYENKTNVLRTKLKEEHMANLENNKYSYQSGVHYMDVIEECEKIGDYVVNVSEAVLEIQ